MTPYGTSVARELRAAIVPIETVSIIDHTYLRATTRALLKNALFWVVPTPQIEGARARALASAETLAETIGEVGVHPQGISLEVDHARTDALEAFAMLIDSVSDAEPTQSAKALGIA